MRVVDLAHTSRQIDDGEWGKGVGCRVGKGHDKGRGMEAERRRVRQRWGGTCPIVIIEQNRDLKQVCSQNGKIRGENDSFSSA